MRSKSGTGAQAKQRDYMMPTTSTLRKGSRSLHAMKISSDRSTKRPPNRSKGHASNNKKPLHNATNITDDETYD